MHAYTHAHVHIAHTLAHTLAHMHAAGPQPGTSRLTPRAKPLAAKAVFQSKISELQLTAYNTCYCVYACPSHVYSHTTLAHLSTRVLLSHNYTTNSNSNSHLLYNTLLSFQAPLTSLSLTQTTRSARRTLTQRERGQLSSGPRKLPHLVSHIHTHYI